jgi:hypothetical protein
VPLAHRCRHRHLPVSKFPLPIFSLHSRSSGLASTTPKAGQVAQETAKDSDASSKRKRADSNTQVTRVRATDKRTKKSNNSAADDEWDDLDSDGDGEDGDDADNEYMQMREEIGRERVSDLCTHSFQRN